MAYFVWKGIDLGGNEHKGKLFARTKEELDAILFKKEIAMLSCSQAKSSLFVRRSISPALKIQFFRQLSELISAGVLLPDALMVICSQTYHVKLQDVLTHVAASVQEGNSLSQALSKYPLVFEPIMVHMVHAGTESGHLVSALDMLSNYLSMIHDFKQKLRSACLVPAVTFGFFFIVALLIFILIIPHFVSMFQSVKQDLPYITHLMIGISDFLRSRYLLFTACACIVSSMLVRSFIKTERGCMLKDSVLLRLPMIGKIIQLSSLSSFLQALTMLTGGGMQLVPAMAIAQETVNNSVIKQHIRIIEHEVRSGSSLSQAMMYEPGQIFGAQAIAIIRVGEESGRLTVLLQRTAMMYQDQIKRTISAITKVINPLLMVVLGLLITFLIFAVYLPVFNLSNII